MSTIVKHESTGQLFVLLGCGRSHPEKSDGGFTGDPLRPDKPESQSEYLCVVEASGRILWFSSAELTVVAVDGKPVAELLDSTDRLLHPEVVIAETDIQVPAEEVIRFLDN